MNMPANKQTYPARGDQDATPAAINGAQVAIGDGFSAQSFRARDIGSAMDPLVLVDHYVMTEPTFGTHPHAGLSAVSLILEDSEGRFHNRDSLGNDFDLLPGDLYWLKAGRGAIHNESPRQGARTHGLQVFVNVGQALRFDAPESLLVRRGDMPLIQTDAHCVRVAMGRSNGVVGAEAPGLPMTILDGELAALGEFRHVLPAGHNAWVHAIDNAIDVANAQHRTRLKPGQAIAINNASGSASDSVHVMGDNRRNSRFVIFAGQAVQEPFVQQGPFVMGSIEEINTATNAYNAGEFGAIA